VGLPSLSPTMESGSISAWTKSKGDEFIAGDVFCQVETDKATVDFEAQDDGYIAKILVEDGAAEVPCGTPIMVTVENEEDIAAFDNFTVEEAEPAAASAAPTPPAPAAVAAPPAPAAAVPPATGTTSSTPAAGRIVASPLAHTLAKQKGFDISLIAGTGPRGRVIAADVNEYVPAAATVESVAAVPAAAQSHVATPGLPAPASIPAAVFGEGYSDYPISGVSLSATLAAAKQSIPHYYLSIDVTLDKLLSLRSSINASVSDDESSISLNDLLVKAAACAVRTVPSVNASWMDTFVRQYQNVDINVVMNTSEGLYQPCLPSVQTTGLASLSRTLRHLSENPTDPNHAKMGTLTVFNGGMYGMKSGAMIIRPPQSCALSLGVAERRVVPGEEKGSVKESLVMVATLSCDHRVVDGAVGAQWLQAFKGCVETPESLLL